MKRLLQNEWFVLLAIILAAALIRFYQLDTLPTGLYHDEAVNGNRCTLWCWMAIIPSILRQTMAASHSIFIS